MSRSELSHAQEQQFHLPRSSLQLFSECFQARSRHQKLNVWEREREREREKKREREREREREIEREREREKGGDGEGEGGGAAGLPVCLIACLLACLVAFAIAKAAQRASHESHISQCCSMFLLLRPVSIRKQGSQTSCQFVFVVSGLLVHASICLPHVKVFKVFKVS